MSEIIWQDPPTPQPPKVEVIARQLQDSPGKWALIETGSPALAILPWWGPLNRSPRFEVKIVNPTGAMWMDGTRDIYARYLPIEDTDHE